MKLIRCDTHQKQFSYHSPCFHLLMVPLFYRVGTPVLFSMKSPLWYILLELFGIVGKDYQGRLSNHDCNGACARGIDRKHSDESNCCRRCSGAAVAVVRG